MENKALNGKQITFIENKNTFFPSNTKSIDLISMFNAKSITVVKSKHQRRKINRCISEKNNYFPCNFYAQHGKNYMQSASDFLLTTLTINDTTAPIVIERKT